MTIIPIPFRANWYPARSGNAWKKAASPRVDLNDFGERLSRYFLPENRPFQSADPGIQFFGAGTIGHRPWTPWYDCRPASIRRLACEEPAINFLELIEYRLTYVPDWRT